LGSSAHGKSAAASPSAFDRSHSGPRSPPDRCWTEKTSMTLLPATPVRVGIEQARTFASGWRATAGEVRVGLVRRLAELLIARSAALGGLRAREGGKPVRFGRVEAKRGAEMLCAIAARFEAATPAAEANSVAQVRRRPHGVVAVITPWNNPIYLPLGKIVPAV